jgi:integrase
LFTLAVFTGMRISELRVLVWGAVDFDRQIIKVLQRAGEFGELGPPKSRAGEREIPMAPTVAEALTEWKTPGLTTVDGLVFSRACHCGCDAAGILQLVETALYQVAQPVEGAVHDNAHLARLPHGDSAGLRGARRLSGYGWHHSTGRQAGRSGQAGFRQPPDRNRGNRMFGLT